uniref:Uncharacterized protein n=1 Tax=Arundo donax TaxID=35708 RepID=A0A0A9FHT8_ARUDO
MSRSEPSGVWCNDLSSDFSFLLADEVTLFLSLYAMNVSSSLSIRLLHL